MREASDLAESTFAGYLDEHGYRHEYEPDLGVARRPDFLIARTGDEVICEVKAFEGWGLHDPAGPHIGSRTASEALAPVREAIRSASRQLKAVRDRGSPLVVVLANPLERPLAIGPEAAIWAMYGDPSVEVSLNPDGATTEWRTVLGRNGKLRSDHAYISAVATLNTRSFEQDFVDTWWEDNVPDDDRRTENAAELLRASRLALEAADVREGCYTWVEVVEALSEEAVSLPRTVFDGPRDRRYAATLDGTAITEVALRPS